MDQEEGRGADSQITCENNSEHDSSLITTVIHGAMAMVQPLPRLPLLLPEEIEQTERRSSRSSQTGCEANYEQNCAQVEQNKDKRKRIQHIKNKEG